MKTYQFMFFISLYVCIGCKTADNKNNEKANSEMELKVIKINEFEYVYQLKTVQIKSNDTLFVLSSKNNFYDKYNLKTPKSNILEQIITINNTYRFKVLRIKPQVSTMAQLGAYIIVEGDTLWKGSNYKEAPKYYSSQNTVGLTLYN